MPEAQPRYFSLIACVVFASQRTARESNARQWLSVMVCAGVGLHSAGNQSAPACIDGSTGQPVCCTANCEVLGTGVPQWSLQDESNVVFGGLVLDHASVLPS